jgi:hypothetical protein
LTSTSPAARLTARENEVIRVLKDVRLLAGKFTVVGGYAVNALASAHRFSVDCDFIISRKDLGEFSSFLMDEGYKRKRSEQSNSLTGLDAKRYYKSIGEGKVWMDLFVDGILCRQTKGLWEYELIKENTLEAIVPGIADSTRSFVPKRELLMAMKIHSGRGTDLRDAVMLSRGADWRLVSTFMNVGEREKMLKQLNLAIETMTKSKFFSGLKSEFSIKTNEQRLTNQTMAGLQSVKNYLS